jgi:hypothetical protein
MIENDLLTGLVEIELLMQGILKIEKLINK